MPTHLKCRIEHKLAEKLDTFTHKEDPPKINQSWKSKAIPNKKCFPHRERFNRYNAWLLSSLAFELVEAERSKLMKLTKPKQSKTLFLYDY